MTWMSVKTGKQQPDHTREYQSSGHERSRVCFSPQSSRRDRDAEAQSRMRTPRSWPRGVMTFPVRSALNQHSVATPGHSSTSLPHAGSIIAIALVVVAGLLLSIYEFRVYAYSDLTGRIYAQHLRLLEGHAGNPTQFRALPEYIWDVLVRLQQARQSGDPIYTSLEVLRYTQNIVLFCLAYAYYRCLGLNMHAAVLGIGVFTLVAAGAVPPNWLRLSSNFDVSFFLCAAILILRRHDRWIIPLSAVAALNRETSGFLPLMLLVARLDDLRDRRAAKEVVVKVGAALLVWFAGYVFLRVVYPPQDLVTDLWSAALRLNLLRETSWINTFSTFGVLPLVALLGFRAWPHVLRKWFWLIVPTWIVVHTLASLINETVLFFEPTVLLIIPGALFAALQAAAAQHDVRPSTVIAGVETSESPLAVAAARDLVRP